MDLNFPLFFLDFDSLIFFLFIFLFISFFYGHSWFQFFFLLCDVVVICIIWKSIKNVIDYKGNFVIWYDKILLFWCLSRVHQTHDRISVIMSISYYVSIQFHIISCLYPIMRTKQTLIIFVTMTTYFVIL